MSLTPVPAVTTIGDSPSVIGVATERPFFEFAGQIEIGAMPHLVNPAALADHALSGLQGYLERLQRVNDTGAKVVAPGDVGNLHSGPARDSLEPNNGEPTGSFSADDVVASLRQTMNFALQVESVLVEESAIVGGTSQVSHATSTLLRGE
jgi:hypothetical protein